MHYLRPLSPASLGRFDRGEWGAYLAANKKFSDRLVEVIAPEDDYVWVHDYHLMLLPSFLRKRFNTCRLGFFLHCPFPSSELFRTFPAREALLRALLNCDVVGFHTFDYARHFLSCCSRMLGLAYESQRGSLGIDYYGRKISIKICPTVSDTSPMRWRHNTRELTSQPPSSHPARASTRSACAGAWPTGRRPSGGVASCWPSLRGRRCSWAWTTWTCSRAWS